jgi:hypothetical protein
VKTKIVPVVIYKNGMRTIIGEAEVDVSDYEGAEFNIINAEIDLNNAGLSAPREGYSLAREGISMRSA